MTQTVIAGHLFKETDGRYVQVCGCSDAWSTADCQDPRIINGCPIVYEANGYSVIAHPNTGFQVYSPDGWRLPYIYKTLEGAKARCDR